MKCGDVKEAIPLYLYGELAAPQEEEVEAHLHGCAGCSDELAVQKRLHAEFDEAAMDPPAHLLMECRRELFQRVAEPAASAGRPRGWFASGWIWPSIWMKHAWLRPAAALALVSAGFFLARVTTQSSSPLHLAGVTAEPMVSTIRSVQPDASGRVQIALDETRRRLVTGKLGDGHIESLLLAAAREEGNTGLRVESLEMLKQLPASDEIRGVLIQTLTHDPNAGVRMKALEALKPMAAHPEVRKTLAYVLSKDENAGLRIQAIDLLVQQHDSALVGLLQNLVTREQNNYVRLRCKNLLEEMNASVGTF
jgi:putative zinc finger protein/HEAT repeat protein